MSQEKSDASFSLKNQSVRDLLVPSDDDQLQSSSAMRVFQSKEPSNCKLEKPIVLKLKENQGQFSKGLYFLSQDMNLQPGSLRGNCYSVV